MECPAISRRALPPLQAFALFFRHPQLQARSSQSQAPGAQPQVQVLQSQEPQQDSLWVFFSLFIEFSLLFESGLPCSQ